MRLRGVCAAAVLTVAASAATANYQVLNERNGVLTGISAAGGVTGSVLGVGGYDMAVDSAGNFVIADGQLTRVTPAGVSTAITSSTTAGFLSVTIDSSGNFIGADNVNHTIYRITSNGATITPVATYPTTANELEDVIVRIDSAGNYVVAEDNGSQAHLFRITPAGSLTAINFTGAAPISAGGLTFDANGNYILLDYNASSIYTITPAGAVTLLVNNAALNRSFSIVRDPSTNLYIVTNSASNSVFSVGSAGSPITTLASGGSINYPGPVVLVNPVGAGPTITQVLNNYGLIPFGFSNDSIAPGSLFIVTGVGLADPNAVAILQSSGGSGLQKVLNGATVQVTVNGVNTAPAFYYAISTQLALVLPSNTPAGTAQLTVSYGGRSSAPFSFQVAPSALGFATYYGTGIGLGIATNTVTGALYSYANPIAPGTTVVLWGSGLGADPARDTVYAPAVFPINNLAHIYIGGVDAPIVYQGASGYPGVNQLDVTVPATVPTGCNVSVVGVTAAGIPTNFVTLPIGAGSCSDPALGTRGSQTASLSALNTVRTGTLSVSPTSASASFQNVSGPLYGAAIGVASPGGCVVSQTAPSPMIVSILFAPLDAGTVTVSGATGSANLQVAGPGTDSAQLPSGFIPAMGGSVAFNATGGATIGSFNTSVTVPGTLTWSTPNSVTRTSGLTVSWTGGAPGDFVTIGGSAAATVNGAVITGTFSCITQAAAGQFTVPSYVLVALPAGAGKVTLSESPNYQTFTAQGVDIGIAQAMVFYSTNATYN